MLGPQLDSLHEERVFPAGHPAGGIWPRVARGFSKTARIYGQFPRPSSLADGKRESALFLLDFEIQNDVLATVEAGDRAGGGFGAFFFRMQFVIGIRI